MLRPATDYQFNLSYTLKNKYTFSAFWNEQSHFFVQLPYQSHERLAVIMKETNFNYRRNIGVQVSATYRLGKWMNGNAFLCGLYDRDKNDNFFDIPFDRSRFTFIGGTTTTFNLSVKPDIRFTMNGFYQNDAIQGVYDIDRILRLNGTLRWQSPDKRMSLSLALNNMTNQAMLTKVDYAGQWYKMKLLGDRRKFLVTFIYRIGDFKAREHNEVDKSRMGH